MPAPGIHSFFERSETFADADPRIRAMYIWHGVEEIEHKGVAFDVLKNVAKLRPLRRIFVIWPRLAPPL